MLQTISYSGSREFMFFLRMGVCLKIVYVILLKSSKSINSHNLRTSNSYKINYIVFINYYTIHLHLISLNFIILTKINYNFGYFFFLILEFY